jgi:WYL_2, Sm-like SH3 beta-barrel fold
MLTVETVRENLVNLLQASDCKVTFTKVDGSERTMRCTLNGFDDEPLTESVESDKKINQETLIVWDLDKEAWRSFRVQNVTNVEVI